MVETEVVSVWGHKDVISSFPPESTSYFLHFEACRFSPIVTRDPIFLRYM